MTKVQHLRTLAEKLVGATVASLSRRPLPYSGHQAAESLYTALDVYADAVIKNQSARAKAAAEQLAVEVLRVLCSYQNDVPTVNVDAMHVEQAQKNTAPEKQAE
jgi:hypothetical protein